MKKLLLTLLTILCLSCCFLFVGCGDNGGNTDNNDQIKQVYYTYVAYAESNGETPMSYEDWLASIKGEKGDKGDTGANGQDGKDGVTPTIEISEDGFWVINGEKTTTKAVGVDGADGKDGTNGANGTNGLDGKDGKDGVDGVTPTIEISEDGFWVINGEKTEYKAIGKDGVNGVNGTNGTNGTNGVGIKKVEFDEQGRLVITLTDDTVLPAIEMPKIEKHIHEYGDWLVFTVDEDIPCENRMFYRVCKDCSEIQLKKGSYEDHDFENVYTTDDSSHWIKCNNCIEKKDKAEHIPDDSGYCTTCDAMVHATVGIIYDKSADGTYAEVVGYEGTAKRVIIAEEYENLPVKSIYNEAFSSKDITSIVIPDSITNIGYAAFAQCDYLNTVIMGSGVESISRFAFYWCFQLQKVYYNGTIDQWAEIDFNYNNSDHGNPLSYADEFYINNILVTEVKLTTASKISDAAFYGYNLLTKVEMPDCVKSIGSSAFSGCNNLTSVTIPDSVTSIGEDAFFGCDNLTSIYFNGDVNKWAQIQVYGYFPSYRLYYYVENETDVPNDGGNYWHYVDGVPTVWTKE